MKFRLLVATIIFVAFFKSALAWDGSTTAKIYQIDVAVAENYGFRVMLEGLPALCGNSHSWAYLNKSSSNYETFVSVLLSARMAQKTVTLHTTKETISGNEYCHIGYITLRPD